MFFITLIIMHIADGPGVYYREGNAHILLELGLSLRHLFPDLCKTPSEQLQGLLTEAECSDHLQTLSLALLAEA